MYEYHLQRLGLTKNQVEIYEILLKTGPTSARKIDMKTKIKRGLVYKTLGELKKLGLIESRNEPNMVSVFEPMHPSKLKDLASSRVKNAEAAKKELDSVLERMISRFNTTTDKPHVHFYEGADGNKKLYDDILRSGKEYRLIRSAYEPTYKEKIRPYLQNFTKKRINKKIPVRAITPADIYPEKKIREKKILEDEKIFIDRTWADKNYYNAPVEIDILENKVAILSYGKEFIGTIIESPQIALAMKQIFELARIGAKVKGVQEKE
jgi:sugar-specific transcriptional regulator TrmB